jgi:hypothetical protein
LIFNFPKPITGVFIWSCRRDEPQRIEEHLLRRRAIRSTRYMLLSLTRFWVNDIVFHIKEFYPKRIICFLAFLRELQTTVIQCLS